MCKERSDLLIQAFREHWREHPRPFKVDNYLSLDTRNVQRTREADIAVSDPLYVPELKSMLYRNEQRKIGRQRSLRSRDAENMPIKNPGFVLRLPLEIQCRIIDFIHHAGCAECSHGLATLYSKLVLALSLSSRRLVRV